MNTLGHQRYFLAWGDQVWRRCSEFGRFLLAMRVKLCTVKFTKLKELFRAGHCKDFTEIKLEIEHERPLEPRVFMKQKIKLNKTN